MNAATENQGKSHKTVGAVRDGQGSVDDELPPFGGGGAQPPQPEPLNPVTYPLPGDDTSLHDVGSEPPSSN